MRPFIQAIAITATLFCALTFLGGLWPGFDSLAIFRPLIWIAAGAGSFFLPVYYKEVARAALILMAFPFLIMFDRSFDFDDPAIRVYQHNLLYTNSAPDLQMVTDSRKPDVLTLQEIKDAAETVKNLKDYPYQQICDFAAIGDVGVISRLPFTDQGCAEGTSRGFAWARIANENGDEVTIVSIHLHWPYPYRQNQQLEELLPQLAALPRPIIMGGDLNQVLWSHTARALEDAIGSPILDGLRFTLVRPPILLPIDHGFGQGTYLVERLERYGSDHNALLIDFQDWPIETQN